MLLVVPLAAVAQPLPAQEGAAAPRQEQTDTEQPRTIPEGQIPSRTDVVAADLRRIEAMLQPDADVSRIEAALVEREAAIVRLLGELDQIDPNRVSARYLIDQRLSWLQVRAELEDWAARVSDRFVALQAERDRLRAERILWEDTSASADPDELAAELLRRIDSTLTRLRNVEARVRERRNAVGAIADRLAHSQEGVLDSIQRLDNLSDSMRGRLLDREAEPLWRSSGAVDVRTLAGEWRRAGRHWMGALRVYLGLHRARVFYLLVLFVVLLVAMLAIRRRSQEWSVDGAALESSQRLLARPYSLSLAFAVAISALLLPFPVGAVTDVLLVLAIVPMVRIGSVILGPETRRLFYGVAALTLLAHIGSLAPEGSMVQRALFLLVGVLAATGAAWTAWHGYRSSEDRDGWHRAADAAATLAAFGFAVAAGAGALGWLGLSRLLTSAILDSAISAFAWAILVAAIAALLPAVLLGRLGSNLHSLRRNQDAVCRVVVRAMAYLALAAWARGTLVRFGFWETVRTRATEVAAAGFTAGGLTLSAGGVLGAVVILIATWLVARLVGFVLLEETLPRFKMRRGAAQSVVTLANYAVYGIGVVLAASAIGLRGTQLTVVIGALSVGIGFGLQTIVNNFVSGLILIFERPIKVGDVVQTVDYWGRIERIGIRASIIRSFDGAEIVVPNGDLIAKEVINWTRSDEIRRIEVLVGVAYGSDPKTVLELLFRVASEHPLTLEEPEPRAQMIDFGNSSLDFRVRCWTTMENWVQVASDLRVVIYDELAEAGITIPFPQRDLHLKSSLLNSEEEKTKLGEAIE
jgi:small-conductance mechanosensitive channel